MTLFLLLSEAQCSGFFSVCKLMKIYARWHSGLPIKILWGLYFHEFCAGLFLLMTNPTDLYKPVLIWFKHTTVFSLNSDGHIFIIGCCANLHVMFVWKALIPTLLTHAHPVMNITFQLSFQSDLIGQSVRWGHLYLGDEGE